MDIDFGTIFDTIGSFIRDYRYIIAIIAAIVLVVIIILFMKKHMPSRGRITDVYDRDGHRKDGKDKKKK